MRRGSVREYTEAVRGRYLGATRQEKGRILDEFTKVTGYHSHTEDFYIPFLGDTQDLRNKASGWVYFYNLIRPHYGEGMRGKPLFTRLRELGYELPQEFALFPPLLRDTISADWAVEGGSDLLAHYNPTLHNLS